MRRYTKWRYSHLPDRRASPKWSRSPAVRHKCRCILEVWRGYVLFIAICQIQCSSWSYKQVLLFVLHWNMALRGCLLEHRCLFFGICTNSCSTLKLSSKYHSTVIPTWKQNSRPHSSHRTRFRQEFPPSASPQDQHVQVLAWRGSMESFSLSYSWNLKHINLLRIFEKL